VDRQAERRELNNGLGDGLALAFQIALTPMVFGFLGYLLDRRIDKVPLFTIIFFLVAMVGVFVSQWAQYEYRMKQADAKAPWAKRPASGLDS
jgi:F0F1-type ATP synthase assembly protein I